MGRPASLATTVRRLVESGDLDSQIPGFEVKATLAVKLASVLDEGAGMATAAVARELRATLNDLCGERDDVDDAFAEFVADLQAPSQHASSA